jgi:DNA protecting protein DprA
MGDGIDYIGKMGESEELRTQSFYDLHSVQAHMKSASRIWERARRDETRAFFGLATMRGVGQKTLYSIAEAGRSFSDVIEDGPIEGPIHGRLAARHDESLSAGRWSAIRSDALSRGDRLAEMLQGIGVTLLLRGDSRFPEQLLDLPRPPHWLFVQGAISLLKESSVAIVGTRNPSTDGIFLAHYVGACLGDWGLPTISGLAAGIDQLAHELSLRAGVPTIAVLGTGILDEYPKGSATLRERILANGGTIVTEYLPRISYSAENFVQRNRLQAALGRILIPVEWSRRSGTAHTVRFASVLKRPIACLRLREWPGDRVALEAGLGLETGKIFTVPREQAVFDHFVRSALGKVSPDPIGQLSLFGED